MALNVQGVPLEFTAVLNDNFSSGMAKITEELKQAANESGKTAEKFNKDFSEKISGSLDKVSDSSKIGKNAIAQLTGSLTSLINPTALVAVGIAAAVKTFTELVNKTKQVKTATELLTEANKKANDTYAERMAKLFPLLELVKEGNLTNEESLGVYKKLAEIDKDLIKGLNQKSIAYESLKVNVDAYADSLRVQYRLEANKEAIISSIKQEEAIKKQLESRQKLLDDANKFTKEVGGVLPSNQAMYNESLKGSVENLTASLQKQMAVTNELAKAQSGLVKTGLTKELGGKLSQINADIAAKTKEREAVSDTREEYKKLTKDLEELEAQKRLITGETEKTVTSNKKENKLLAERQSLLLAVISLKRGSYQSGLTKEVSALDQINENYDNILRKVNDFNKTAPKSLQIDKSGLDQARQTELQNTTYKQNSKDFTESLSVQRKAFEDYEKAKVEIGEEKAKELYQSQIKGADSYLDYLKKQQLKIKDTVTNKQAGKANIQQTIELDILNKKIQDETEKSTREQVIKQIEGYSALLKEVTTYNERKLSINKHYDDLEKAARDDKSATQQQTKERLAIIEASRKEALKGLENDVARQSEIYKKLGEDMTFFTKEQLKKRAADLQKDLIDPKQKLSPATKAAVKSLIDQINQLLDQTDTIPEKFSNIANGLNEISGSLQGVDDVLSKNIATLGRLAGAVSTTLTSIKTLSSDSASGAQKLNAGFGLFGAFFSVVGVINGIINNGAQHRSELKQQEEQQLLSLQTGEISINDEYRKRVLLQAELNKLRVNGLQAEAEALQSNLESTQKDYDKILNLIQIQGKAKPIGFDLEAIKNLQAMGVTNSYIDQYNKAASLTGKTFDELQKLDFTGQLDDKAKALFETLKGLRDQIEETKKQQDQNIQQTAEQLTGTTSDAILNSIVEGFKNGKKASKDFADDFESLMRESLFNSLKYQTLKEPLEKLYAQFAADAKSGGVLTETEIANLKETYNTIITAGKEQYDNLQKLTGIDLNAGLGSNNNTNSLKGGISAITENTAEVLAGRLGGMALTAIQQLNIAMNSLNTLNKIEFNTSRLEAVEGYLRKFDQQGIKIQ